MKASAFRDLAAMAFRNLGRHRVKTIITTLAVTISVALYIFMDAWLLGMNLDSRRNIVAYETGAAKIQTEAYFANKDEAPMYESFQGWEAIAARLEASGYDAAPRFAFSGTLYSREGTAPMEFIAMDPEREARLLRYAEYLESGRFPRPGRLEIAVGSTAAEKLGIGIPMRPSRETFESELLAAATTPEEEALIRGLYVPLAYGAEDERPFALRSSAPPEERLALREDASAAELERLWVLLAASGRMDVRIFTVIDRRDEAGVVRHVNQLLDAVLVGVVNSPNPKTNGNVAYLPLDALQDEAGLMLEGHVTELLVRAKGADESALPGASESPEAIRAALGPVLPEGVGVHAWLDYVGDYLAAAAGDNVSSRIMIGFLFLLSFIGIANTMLMAILERTKETGMLRALGMSDSQVLLAYTMEAGMVGFMGSLIGIALGCLANIPMVAYGVDYSAVAQQMGGDFGYRIVAFFRSAWNLPTIIGSGLVATLLSALAAIPPTLRALKLPVTESLRFE